MRLNIEEIYDGHVEKVYKFFYIKCFDKHVAEDLTSQTFMVLVERMHDAGYSIDNPTKFVYGVMRNVWLMYLRDKYRRAAYDLVGIEDFEAYVEEETEEYEAMTVKQRADVFIRRLPEKQQAIVRMRLLEGQSIKGICQETDKDANYVKTTYKRGLKRLKQLIKDNDAAFAVTSNQEVL